MNRELRRIYRQNGPALERAEEYLQEILKKTISSIEDKDIVRAEIQSTRIKEYSSLKRKVVKNNWAIKRAFKKCGDLVGGRVTCNNIEDVYRFYHILKDHIDNSKHCQINRDHIQDYIKNPLKGGYRALHINFRLDANKNLKASSIYISCEVQIRSLLQHAWGELTHQDIYKRQEIPEDLRARAKDISEMLAAVDKIASDIRSRAMQKVTSSGKPLSLKNVSKENLAWYFNDAFGRSPYDYVIERARNICDHLDIRSLENFSEKLKDIDFQQKLNNFYQKVWEMNINISREDIFFASLYSLRFGDRVAIRWIELSARRELERIEREIQQEVLLSLPETIEEFIEHIDTSSIEANDDIEIWAEALGAIDECKYCSMNVVHTDIFAENILEYYDISEEDEDWEDHYRSIESALIHSGVEIGGLDAPDLCARCAAKMEKDD